MAIPPDLFRTGDRDELSLTGPLNFRDLGGLPTEDGRVTRCRRLFRSDTLQEATDDDITRLQEDLGLMFVIDLRGAEESVAEGRGGLVRLPLCHINIPLRDFSSLVDPDAPDILTAPDDPDADAAGGPLMSHYVHNLAADQNLVIAVELIANALAYGPTVVHCAFGKDRTGIVVALILRMIGVTEKAVVGDYMASAENVDRFIERARRTPRYAPFADLDVWRCDERMIAFFLRELTQRYGSATEWALHRGIPAESIDRLRTALLG